MATQVDNLFSDPSVQFLQKLLDDVRLGDITLPRFQRPFVWDKERRLQLFDSVGRGIPIGSLMIWETRALSEETQIAPKTELGPFVLPKVVERAPRLFLLDGEQRLMTLYFALYLLEPRADRNNEEPAEAFEVFFDLEEQKFVTREDLDDGPSYRYFPLREIFVPRGVLKFQRKTERALMDALRGLHPANVEAKIASYIERSDTIAEAVKRLKIPITTLSTDDIGLAIETFRRVNSQGVPMSVVHMMNALTFTGSFELLDRFAGVRSGIEGHPYWQDGNNLDDDTLLRICMRLLRRDVYGDDASVIAPMLRDGEIFVRLKDSMQRCADFLAARGLRNPGHVPSRMQLVVLGYVFDAIKDPSMSALDRLEDWLWFTSYTETFNRTARGSAYQALEEQAIAVVQGDLLRAPSRKPLRKPLPRFDFRNNRSCALSWMLAKRMMTYDGGDAADALAASGSGAMLRLATAPAKSQDIGNSSAIRVLYRAEHIDALRDAIRNGTVDPKLLEAQVITGDALRELRKKPRDLVRFAALRERALNELEDRIFEEVQTRLFQGSRALGLFDDESP